MVTAMGVQGQYQLHAVEAASAKALVFVLLR